MKIKKILFWANENKSDVSSLRRAVQIAQQHKARLTIVGVVERVPEPIKSHFGDEIQIELQTLLINEKSSYLEKLRKKQKDALIRVDTKVLVGKPYYEIIKEVLENKGNLVITTAKEQTEVNEIIFGSNAMHLMRKCPCPVLVLRPTFKRKIKKILVAVDVVSENEEELTMNRDLIKQALQLAEVDNAEVHILHTWSIYGEYYLLNYTKQDEEEILKIINETKEHHRKQLLSLVKKNAPHLPEKNIHLIKGDADEKILEIAVQMKVDLIVMGTVGRVGLQGIFIGNTAEKVLQHVDCSVFALKPAGFISPVS